MTVATQQITITRAKTLPGSSQITWNVDLGGRPFGQIWTFRNTPTTTYGFAAKALGTEGQGGFPTYAAAERFLRGCM